MESNLFNIGQRVGIEASDAGVSAVGTVRYVGFNSKIRWFTHQIVGALKTESASNEIWIGVEWDDLYKRGKHNGNVNGILPL